MRCAQDDFDANTAKLNMLVAALKTRLKDAASHPSSPAPELPADVVSKLDDAQAAWQVFVEQQCTLEGKFWYGNSAAPMAAISCRATRAAERIEQLRLFLCDDQGRDGICPEASKY